MSDASSFGKLVPGFDFLQNLVKSAGSAMPGIGQWVAPTLDPAELEKRISELRTVQYWLEQNARMLAATIQALEVQRMTLSTLKSMNVQMGDLTESLKIKPASSVAEAAAAERSPGAGEEGRAAEGRAPGRRPDAVVGRAHQPVRRARHQRDEGQRRRCREGARRRNDEAVDRRRRRDDEKVAGAPGRAVAGAAKSLAARSTGAGPKNAAPARKKKKAPSRPRATPAAT